MLEDRNLILRGFSELLQLRAPVCAQSSAPDTAAAIHGAAVLQQHVMIEPEVRKDGSVEVLIESTLAPTSSTSCSDLCDMT